MSFSSTHAVFLLPPCSILFTLMCNLFLSLSSQTVLLAIFLLLCSLLSPSFAYTSLSVNLYPSYSLARSVLLSLINQRRRPGGGTLVPLVHAHNSRNSAPPPLPPLLLYLTRSCSTYAIKIFAWPISRKSINQLNKYVDKIFNR